ncbi:MAG TPA: GDSL-type esterase/lipase family protein [Polyangiaceae bacterium]|nr:GDSL-type esterase/lipase family protein [Polyangiaceae bacterium]
MLHLRSPSVPRSLLGLAFASALALATPPSLAQAAGPRLPTHVACVGDSITAGVGDQTADGGPPLGPYPTQLATILAGQDPGVNVQNFGHSGATLLTSGDTPYIQQVEYQNATSFVSNAGANAVVDVVIMLGTNDSKPTNWNAGANATAFTNEYIALVQHFADLPTAPQIYLMLPPAAFTNTFTIDGTVIVQQIDPLIRAVATQENTGLIDLYTPTENMPQLFGDGVHPIDVGYTLIANIVASALLAVPDAGTAPSDDAGASMEEDSGSSVQSDASVPADAGSAPVDGGASSANDAGGTSQRDSSVPIDGSARHDGGSVAADATSGEAPDAETSEVDAMTSTGDNGSDDDAGDDASAADNDGGNGVGTSGSDASASSPGNGSSTSSSSGGGCAVAHARSNSSSEWPWLACGIAAVLAGARRRRRV